MSSTFNTALTATFQVEEPTADGPQPEATTDDALMARVADNDSRAFALLLSRHEAGVRRFCIAALRDREAGRDRHSSVTLEPLPRPTFARLRWIRARGEAGLLRGRHAANLTG